MRTLNNILVTGGAGFIGSNFIHFLFKQSDFKGKIINLDKMTYAGNPDNISDIQEEYGGARYYFEQIDINNYDAVLEVFQKYDIDTVVHFAAESHVDRSITGPKEFIYTNIVGTFNLLEAARTSWKEKEGVLFHHISTDEVYGSLEEGYFYENTKYNPNSPYAASKASSDHLVRAYHKTYGIPVTVSNCSNNFGPYQFPEKMIPLMVINIIEGKDLPVYGKGENIRDWLYVDDHCDAIWLILKKGSVGDTYNIGTDNQWKNIDLVNLLCEKVSKITEKPIEECKRLIKFTEDRLGHDLRYAVNADKFKKEFDWSTKNKFEDILELTIKWYLNNPNWIKRIKTGEYQK